jgi:hypothetical protein
LREELLQQKNSEIKSKFLVKFLYREPIIKLLIRDILLPSIPNDNGLPEENDFTTLITQFLSMLISSGDIPSRVSLSPHLHSFLIPSLLLPNRDLTYCIETIEDCCQNSHPKHLRHLRLLFSCTSSHRELSTHLLKKHSCSPSLKDILKDTFDLESPSDDVFLELNYFCSGVTMDSKDFENLYQIFTMKEEVEVKKAALEQMAVMLGERKEETGRKFFRGKS